MSTLIQNLNIIQGNKKNTHKQHGFFDRLYDEFWVNNIKKSLVSI